MKELKLMDMMLRAYPYCVINIKVANEYLSQGGMADSEHFRKWLEANGYWRTYFNS